MLFYYMLFLLNKTSCILQFSSQQISDEDIGLTNRLNFLLLNNVLNAVDVRVTMDKECENKIGKFFLKNYYILFSSFLLEKGEFSRKKREPDRKEESGAQ